MAKSMATGVGMTTAWWPEMASLSRIVAGATLTTGSTLKFELMCTDSGSTEQGICERLQMDSDANPGVFLNAEDT